MMKTFTFVSEHESIRKPSASENTKQSLNLPRNAYTIREWNHEPNDFFRAWFL